MGAPQSPVATTTAEKPASLMWPIIYSSIGIVFLFLALLVDEKLSLINWVLRGLDPKLNDFAGKWEVLSLLLTSIFVTIYWFQQMKTHKSFPKFELFALCNAALIASLLALYFAAKYVADPLYHAACLLLLALLFLLADWGTWKWTDDSLEDIYKRAGARSFMFADVPICFGFFVMATYVLLHPLLDSTSTWGPHCLSLPYFLAGMSAFQLLYSNSIFIVIEWLRWYEESKRMKLPLV